MRFFVSTLIAATCMTAGYPASAQNYPNKPVRVIVPFAAGGGGLDIVLRPMLQKVSENLQQQFVLDIRAVANGIIGTDIGAKAPADGYTLIGATTGTITINPHAAF